MTWAVCASVAPHQYDELLTEPAARIAAWKEEQRVSESGQASGSWRAGGVGRVSSWQGRGAGQLAQLATGQRGSAENTEPLAGHTCCCVPGPEASLTWGPLWTSPVPDRPHQRPAWEYSGSPRSLLPLPHPSPLESEFCFLSLDGP